MATLSITIDDAQLVRVRNAMCAHVGVDPSTLTAAQANATARAALVQTVKNIVREQEDLAARQAIQPGPDPAVS